MRILWVLLLSCLPFLAQAGALQVHGIVLMQSEEAISARTSDAAAMVDYVDAVVRRTESHLDGLEGTEPFSGFIVLAVRRGPDERAWLDVGATSFDESVLIEQIERVPGFPVGFGTVVFAIKVSYRGAAPPDHTLPRPAAWKTDAPVGPEEVEAVVGKLWPDATGATERAVQADWIEETLSPLDGTIERPSDWYFNEAHQGRTMRWIISKENAGPGKPYETGMSLQVLVGVKEATGVTAEQTLRKFLEGQKRNATEFEYCEEEEQGLFIRMCVESVEGPYRVLYSVFWGRDDLDVGIITVAGAPREEWEQVRPIFDRLSRFTLMNGAPSENKQPAPGTQQDPE